MKLPPFLVALFVLIAPSAHAADGHFAVADLPSERIPILMTALLEGLPLRGEARPVSRQDPWPAEEEPSLKAAISRAIARFKIPETMAGQGPESFDISFDFLPDQLLIRTSLSMGAGSSKTLSVPYDNARSQRQFLGAEGRPGVAVWTPEFLRDPHAPRGALICPRKQFRYQAGGVTETALVESHYRVVRGLFLAEAQGSAKAPNAQIFGSILTTPNISRSNPWQAEAGDTLAMSYHPDLREMLPGSQETETITGAIQLDINFRKAPGGTGARAASDVVWFRSVKLTNEQAWFAPFKGGELRVAPGLCYVMWQEKNVLSEEK